MIHLVLSLMLAVPPTVSPEPGPLVHALWLVQAKGLASENLSAGDQRIKATLAKALAGDAIIRFEEVSELFGKEQFQSIADKQNQLTVEQLKNMADAITPVSRKAIYPALASHLDLLTTSFDMIDQAHRSSAAELTEWIAKNYRPDRDLHVTVVCTGNSRRSMLGACLGNVAATYYGLDKLHFHSGGTTPSAFNSRTITALTDMGFKISASGQEAPRGDTKTPNPIYNVSWGNDLECKEFSKVYSDPANPQADYAAIMVCSEADNDCPNVKGAVARISMPFLDPKIYDGGSFERAKYAERRDDIARTLLMAICQAKRTLQTSIK